MEDRLSGRRTVELEDHQAVGVQYLPNRLRHPVRRSGNRGEAVLRGIEHVGPVGLGDDEGVPVRHRENVHEHQRVGVLVHPLRRGLATHDLAEHALRAHCTVLAESIPTKTTMTQPRNRFLTANRLRLHLLEWGGTGPVVLLLHGYLEHAHAWDWVAPHLASAGYHVFALDWRGHGESEWIGPGGYYHFVDYVADLDGLVQQLGGSVALIGHSMGGGAAVLYTGTAPQRVRALVSIEGLGMPDLDPSGAPERVADWLHDLTLLERRGWSGIVFDLAVERMRHRFPLFSEAAARHLVEHGTRDVAGERVWRFDPLHRTRSPLPMPVATAQTFWDRVACPVLYVEGAQSRLRLSAADIDARLAALRARRVTIPDAGHHPHVETPQALVPVLLEFLAATAR